MTNRAARRRLPLGLFLDRPKPSLYDWVVEVLRTRHYSRRTEEAYSGVGTPGCHTARGVAIHWIRRLILFHNGTRPCELAEGDVNRFLTRTSRNRTERTGSHKRSFVLSNLVCTR